MKSKCPICKKPSEFKYRPFCSKRCADIDFAHWMRGDYRIEGQEEKKGEETEEEEDEIT